MCVVSMVSDWGRTQPWAPDPIKPWKPTEWLPGIPQQPQVSEEDLKKIKEFLKLLEEAKKFDEATKQPDCIDDRKDKFEKELIDLLKKHGKL